MSTPRRSGAVHGSDLYRLLGGLTFAAAIGGIALPLRAQTSDVTPPSVQAFSFTPATVDVSGSNQSIALSVRVTDDLSGTSFVSVTVRSPSTLQQLSVTLSRTSGDARDGIWAGNLVVPQYTEAGTWTVIAIQASDVAGNSSSTSTAVLESRGLPTQFTVISNPDTQPPTITALTITPGSVNVSASDQLLTLDVHVTDDLAGASLSPCVPFQNGTFVVILRSPSGAQNRFLWSTGFSLVTGSRIDGTWRSTVTMPKFSEAGTWRVQSMSVRDCVGNLRSLNETQIASTGLQSSLTVVASPTDIQPPQLTSLSFLPIAINTSTGNQTVTVRLGIGDDLSGADVSTTTPQASFFERGIQFRSPSGIQLRSASFFSTFNLISGGPLGGVWESTINFPQFSEDGTWKVDFVAIKDRTRNIATYSTEALQSLNFPTTLEVIKPSLVTDGTVASGGGLVKDQVFGDRASVFFPVGALTVPTQVAIDVLSKPLDVPNPTGFTGPGSLFVNIHLTPQPTFPLPFPGLTVILPLSNPMISGSQLSLYKVDPATGGLIPAVNLFGGPVIGHVDADGLSATFLGIASLSTVVGLIPEALNVGVDIKPGDDQNTLNLKSRGVLPVAILSNASFDATTVLPETVLLGDASVRLKGNGQPFVSFEDVNGDGRLDMLLQFDTQSLGVKSDDTEAQLTGRTKDGLRIVGHDSIRIAP